MTRRNDALRQALDDLQAAARLFPAAEQRIMDARAALPGAASYDGPRGGGGSSSTERHALTPDPTAHDRALLDSALAALVAQSYTLLRLTQAWTPRTPSAKDRAEVERVNRGDDGCAHHAAWGTWEPVHCTGTAGGVLEVALPLCRWCWDRTRTDGRLPSADRMQRRADGRADRVKVEA